METMLNEMELAIGEMVAAAKTCGDSNDSERFSQAALNLTNAWARVKEATKATAT